MPSASTCADSRPLFLCLAFFLLCLQNEPCDAMIPRACFHNLTKPDAVCCPTPKDNNLPCGGPGIGRCLKYQVYQDPYDLHHKLRSDDRINWPTRLFKYGCHCDGKRWGFACQECWFGWAGPDCATPQILVRRNILSYTALEKKNYRKVILKSHTALSNEYVIFEEKYNNLSDPLKQPKIILDASLHEVLVYIHRYASRSTLLNSAKACGRLERFDMNHRGAGFVTWHRFFMLFWERQVAKLALREFGIENFLFPYWDWTDATHCEVCTADLIGDLSAPRAGNNTSPFVSWRHYCQPPNGVLCAGCHTRLQADDYEILKRKWRSDAKFPTKAQVKFVLSRPRYYDKATGQLCSSFTHALEGYCKAPGSRDTYVMHNGVHNCVNGPFSTSSGSTNDPLFPIHHLQVDRVFAAWFERHRPHSQVMPTRDIPYGHCRDCSMAGFIPPLPHSAMLVDTRALGYMYDSLKFGESKRRIHKWRRRSAP